MHCLFKYIIIYSLLMIGAFAKNGDKFQSRGYWMQESKTQSFPESLDQTKHKTKKEAFRSRKVDRSKRGWTYKTHKQKNQDN